MRSASVAFLVLFAVACGDPTSVTDGVLTVRRDTGHLELQNGSSTPLSYFVVERSASALVLSWQPCTGPRCPTIGAHAAVSVPDSAIVGFTAAAREALVFWWHAVSDSTQLVPPDSIHSLIAPLLRGRGA